MTNFRQIFENDWCGIEYFLNKILSPIFGDYEQGYDILTNAPEVREKAENANITEIRHAASFDFFGSELKVFDITVGDNKKLENNKVGIQTVVRQYINQFEGALIIFHHQNVENQEWRFSYVEKRLNAKDSTSAKRYTYILGKGHPARTIAERFNDLERKKNKSETILLPDLTNAFAVAPLSDDFFNEYRKHYADLVEYISGKRFVKKGGKFIEEKTKKAASEFANAFNGDDKAVRDFVKKMMGRLVFLQFLQKKGWLGVQKTQKWGTGDKNFIYNLFKNADVSVKNDFLEQALEPLFFKSLNCDRGVEAIAPKAVCSIYRSEIRIPYLNGGLFEADELDKKKVKFKKEHFESLFEFFNQYNFTIDETDPDDVEIGVDPEMLGKIFENLLENNKDKGAFYTPKEIVQYMCRESLIAYLETETAKTDENGTESARTNVKDKIRNFVLNHDATSFSEKEKADILKALIDVKICDPAVGSGAFPMGMLNELLPCVQILTGEAKTRSELKKHIVKNNIYGVDIEKGAVDIARLRFWLAIIVDEEEPLPLPNLDYKIMQGNSLLESFEGEDLSNMTKQESGNLFDNGEAIAKLTQAINGFYIPHDHVAKAKIRAQIKENIIQLLKERQLPPKVIEDLTKLDLHENSQFFLWHTWFYDVFNRPNDCNGRNGFDIVIGNPPYIRRTSLGEFQKRQYEKKFESAIKQYDLYLLFIENGIKLLRKEGYLCFINPIRFFNSDYGLGARKFIITKSKLKSILNISQIPVFQNALTYPCVLLIWNQIFKNEENVIKYQKINSLSELNRISLVQSFNVSQKEIQADLEYRIIVDANPKLKSIISKMNKMERIKDLFEIARGLPNNKIDSNGKNYFALKSTDVKKYFISHDLKKVNTEFANVFKKEMIIFPRTVAYLQAALKDKEIVCLDRIYYLKESKPLSLKYVLGTLNSKITNVWFEYYYNTTKVSGGYFDLNGNQIGSIPIPTATPAQQQEVITLVDKILAAKKDCHVKHSNDSELVDTSKLEKQLDALVYKLYGLTDDEIKIIEF